MEGMMFFIAISFFCVGPLIAADQAPFLPDDILKQIVVHCHQSQHRLVNKYFRDNVIIHLFKPVIFKPNRTVKSEKMKKLWFREMMNSNRLYMHDCWSFNSCFSIEFIDDALRQNKNKALKIKFLNLNALGAFMWRRDVTMKSGHDIYQQAFRQGCQNFNGCECIVELKCTKHKVYDVTFLNPNNGQ